MPHSWDMGQILYFPSGGRHAEDFYIRKIQRLRLGLDPKTWVREVTRTISVASDLRKTELETY